MIKSTRSRKCMTRSIILSMNCRDHSLVQLCSAPAYGLTWTSEPSKSRIIWKRINKRNCLKFRIRATEIQWWPTNYHLFARSARYSIPIRLDWLRIRNVDSVRFTTSAVIAFSRIWKNSKSNSSLNSIRLSVPSRISSGTGLIIKCTSLSSQSLSQKRARNGFTYLCKKY